jgi:hypothetical protein
MQRNARGTSWPTATTSSFSARDAIGLEFAYVMGNYGADVTIRRIP